MRTRLFACLALAVIVTLAAGCDFERKTTAVNSPTTPTDTTSSSGSYVGTWSSGGGGGTVAPNQCGSFKWTVTNQTSTTLTGGFTAKCGDYAVTGTGSGQVNGTTVTVTLSGSGAASGVPVCTFSLSGTGTITNADTITIPYTGTTCFGTVSGTETLKKALLPNATLSAPTLVSPINNASLTATQPTLVLTNSARTGTLAAVSYLFQVATDSAFSSVSASGTISEGSSQTSYTVSPALSNGAYYWRARGSDGSLTSSWSSTGTFTVTVTTPTPTQSTFDLSTATIVVGPAAFASWKQTSSITYLSADSSTVCIQHSMLGKWPKVAFFGDANTMIEGNQWYFALINGKWYGGAGEWLSPGQSCKSFGGGPVEFYDPKQEPLHSWVPKAGDLVGFAVSTPARAWPQMATANERSDVKFVRWQ